MKQVTLDRAKRALRLIEEGVSLTRAAKAVKMKPKTLKKALKKLQVRTRKVKGRYLLLRKVYKEKIDKVIYYMMGGWSATRACAYSGTTLRTMRKVTVKLTRTGKASRLLTKTKGGVYYRLNVYKVHGYPTVFYGRLMSLGEVVDERTGKRNAPIPISGKKYPGPVERDPGNLKFDDPNYYNIMWQLDFDPFHSTVLPEDVAEHYPGIIMRALHAELVDTGALFKIFVHCTGFSEKVECGVDMRGMDEEYMSVTEFRRRAVRKDVGLFEVIVRGAHNMDEHYPDPAQPIEFKHDLRKEEKIQRRI